MEADANWWLTWPDGVETGRSGINATLRDYRRFGLFVMNDGVIGSDKLLPDGWFDEAGSWKIAATGGRGYGYLWWAAGGDSLADGTFEAIGISGQHIFVDRKEKVVVVVWSAQLRPTGGAGISDPAFFDGVVGALEGWTPQAARVHAPATFRGPDRRPWASRETALESPRHRRSSPAEGACCRRRRRAA